MEKVGGRCVWHGNNVAPVVGANIKIDWGSLSPGVDFVPHDGRLHLVRFNCRDRD